LQLAQLRLSEYWEPTTSYLSVIELGLYDSTTKVYKTLVDRAIEPHSEEWNREIQQTLARQKEAMRPAAVPRNPPNATPASIRWNRKRGEDKNWYTLPHRGKEPARMGEHGLVADAMRAKCGRSSPAPIGFDGLGVGVDLFPTIRWSSRADLEMRSITSARCMPLFGQFYVGWRCPASELGTLLEGQLPPRSRS